jgi:ankyrin repeat protein
MNLPDKIVDATKTHDVIAVVDLLKKYKLYPDQRSTSGEFPLVVAVIKNDLDISKLLISNFRDLNCDIPNPMVFCTSVEMIDLLLFNNFDINEINNNAELYSIHELSRLDKRIILKCIEVGADINQLDKNGKTPLWYSISQHSHPDNIADIIDCGGDFTGLDIDIEYLICCMEHINRKDIIFKINSWNQSQELR